MPKFNLFRKIVLVFIIMLIPILSLYLYSYRTTMSVLENELKSVNINQLEFFQSQMNAQVESLSQWPQLLLYDPDISDIRNVFQPQESLDLDMINLVKQVQTKLSIQENSSNWDSQIYVYSPILERVITSTNVNNYYYNSTEKVANYEWTIQQEQQQSIFSIQVQYPFTSLRKDVLPNLLIKVEFNSKNIVDNLDKFKSDGRSDPFFYKEGYEPVTNSTANKDLIAQMISQLEETISDDIEGKVNHYIEVNGSEYWVGVVPSVLNGWHLVDYVPLDEIMKPIYNRNKFFIMIVIGLVLMSVTIAYMLYSQVQVPMKELVRSFQKIKRADYKVRINTKSKSEFSYLYTRFNAMAEQIQDLFERVYLQQLHVKEAKLKQLQSQINPHFFYNCFNFITSMAKLEDMKAVVAMTENLASYYRYTTRQERDVVTMKEELEFVKIYLEIQNMRLQRLEYDIQVSSYVQKIEIPLLVIQPIVENAVIHGIEPTNKKGLITISTEIEDDYIIIAIDDDGIGLEYEKLVKLQYNLSQPMDETMGCGLWNVHHRLQLKYAGKSGVYLKSSSLGGLRVELVIDQTKLIQEYASQKQQSVTQS